jgi:hypothetical protein
MMPPTEQDRDDLARMFFTARQEVRWQTWEQTSEGVRAWCRAKADEAMAAGWRKVRVDEVVVSRSAIFHADIEHSKGTKDMINQAKRANVECVIYP